MNVIKYFEKGSNLFDIEDYTQCINWLNKALKHDPEHVQSLHIRALAKGKIADYQGAIDDFEKALVLQPANAVIVSDRALVYHFMGEKDKSMADFDRAVKLEPENGYRYASRAFIKDRIGDLQGAIDDYNKAIALDPEDAISINNRGMVEEKMGYSGKAKQSFMHADELDSILKSNDIQHAPKTDYKKPKFEKPPIQSGNSMSMQNYFRVLKGVFTNRKEFSAFVRFCKNGFKA